MKIIKESHGTSLYGLDNVIKMLYKDVQSELNYKYEEDMFIDEQYEAFNIDNINVKFKTDFYILKIKLNEYFKDDIFREKILIIKVNDIIDDNFSNNFNQYKKILEDYNGTYDNETDEIIILLNSYNRYIDPKPFFIICIHELQHFYTRTKHKNIKQRDTTLELSNEIQDFIYKSRTFNLQEIETLTKLFYCLFCFDEISSYSSQFYGELIAKLNDRKFKTRSINDLIENTDAEKLLFVMKKYINNFNDISAKKIFTICDFVYKKFKLKYPNAFINNIEIFYKNNDYTGFKKYLLKIFNINYHKLNSIIEKIASNYFLCERYYPFLNKDPNKHYNIIHDNYIFK